MHILIHLGGTKFQNNKHLLSETLDIVKHLKIFSL